MATKADKIKQVNQIIDLFEKITTKKHKMWELLSKYNPKGDPWLKDSEWAKECSYKTFERRFREAIVYYQECSKINRDKEVGLAKEQYDVLYYEAFKKGEIHNAIAALKAKRELFGLDKPLVIETRDGTDKSIEELEKEKKQLEKMLKKMDDKTRNIIKNKQKYKRASKNKSKK